MENKLLIEQYEMLLFQRDDLIKEGEQLHSQYISIFGEWINEIYKLKIECIALKKKISYCQKMTNTASPIIASQLEAYVSEQMAGYYAQLEYMVEEYKCSKQSKTISSALVSHIKKLYRRIVKKIHPDWNPALFESLEVQELWNKIQDAYNRNDLEALMECEVLVNKYAQSEIQIDHIEEKIKKLEEQIHTIQTTIPYLYKDLLKDDNKIQQKKEEFGKELESFKIYSNQLQDLFSQFYLERMVS